MCGGDASIGFTGRFKVRWWKDRRCGWIEAIGEAKARHRNASNDREPILEITGLLIDLSRVPKRDMRIRTLCQREIRAFPLRYSKSSYSSEWIERSLRTTGPWKSVKEAVGYTLATSW